MSVQQAIEYFKTKFPFLGNDEQSIFFEIMEMKAFNTRQLLINRSEYCNRIYYVVQGLVRGYYYHEEGHEMTMFFWQENQITASWESIYMQQPASIYYETVEPSVLAVINFEQLKKITHTNNNILLAYTYMLEEILANSLYHLQSYMNEKPEQRYKRFLNESPEIVDRISQKLIASYVGITPISLSRMKKRINSEKL